MKIRTTGPENPTKKNRPLPGASLTLNDRVEEGTMEEAHSDAQICSKSSWRSAAQLQDILGVIPLSELSMQSWSWVFYRVY